ncbi:hypothetical protein B1757_04885 [Acidithiobacillus marinus]|uniref:Uncharacterized protein n=1 Tax=Acidithiobacillus marinus TaxID=187490 RepID=A0A2I1DN78_9PROT|nr:hypothetical protein B1757_04885 [Acidithiobacillus marinus]
MLLITCIPAGVAMWLMVSHSPGMMETAQAGQAIPNRIPANIKRFIRKLIFINSSSLHVEIPTQCPGNFS